MTMLRNNLLKRAMRSIPTETIQFESWKENTLVNGEDVALYNEPITINASVQEIKTEMYKKLDLDFEKDYICVYANVEIKGIDKQETPDRVYYQGSYWNAVKNNNWHQYDGWSSAICVRVK